MKNNEELKLPASNDKASLSDDESVRININDRKESEDKLSFQSRDTLDSDQLNYNEKKPELSSTISTHITVKVPGQERITIIEDVQYFRSAEEGSQQPSINAEKKSHPRVEQIKDSKVYQWFVKQCNSADNRYAFQMSIGFIIAAIFVVVSPLSDVFANAFWIGISVVTVLDNTVGGLVNLSLQRLLGTIIGGVSSIVVMTITRAIFQPSWDHRAIILLCFLMFVQVFFIAKIKIKPNTAYAGSIGLLTTVIILLSGYSELIQNRLSYTAELGSWRTLNLIIGIVISLIVSVFVFPVKASSVMRKNLGKAMEDAADLYQKSSEFYLDFSGSTTAAVNESLASTIDRHLPNEEENHKLSDIMARTFTAQPPDLKPDLRSQIRQQLEESDQFWKHSSITSVSNEAFSVLAKLQTESTRLRNVSNEYYIQSIFRIFGGKERCKRHMRRAKRYNEAIEAMKSIAWPLVSFRLLQPLVSLNQTTQTMRADGSPNLNGSTALQERITPTKETLESFSDSLRVMYKLGRILKDYKRSLSDFAEDWVEIDRMVTNGNLHIQRELKQTVKAGMYSHNLDGLKLLSYYGFLVRCSMIWDGLKTVVEKLSPLNGTLSRASSMGMNTPLPNREVLPVPE
ncbi:hypothetical protein CU098_013114 [Rhizopus stolonifer]|uniref:Uncharacterized protein n=1 Tax=Rhizopus stolonifer TaxID=4846 RepID=A0A367KSL8_RHIST|nr:hypothetical protein CU098_013114 [Rhizopus stolonifer]